NFYFVFPQFVNQLTKYTEDVAVRVAEHLKDTISSKGIALTDQSFNKTVKKEILKVMKDLRLEKIKIFSKSGEILFSSNPKEVGLKNNYDYFHTQIALGNIYSKRVQKNTKTMEGRIVDIEVVESYVPLMSEGVFLGAIEVYYDITNDSKALTLLLDRLKISIIAFSFIFLSIFFIIIFKASRNILERDIAETSLKKIHENLEKKVAERTAQLKETNQSLIIEIEEHRMSDLALRESETRLRSILEANPDPMIMYDLKGHPQYINPEFTKLFGWSLEELKGRVIPFVPEDQKQFSAEKIKEIYQTGKTVTFETKRFTKGNHHLDVLISAAVTRKLNGKPVGMVVNITNISEKKAVEAQNKQARRLESIGTLAGGIAHDFNNILSVIFGYSQLAKMNIEDKEKLNDNIDQILKGAQRAAELVHQILTFSRQSEHKKQPLNVFILVKEALKLLRSSIPSTIDIKETDFSEAAVMADPIQIHQVIMNLCTNAYQAMYEKGGVLTVGLKEVDIPGQDNILELNMISGKYLRLEVSDTGYGIGSEVMDKIFDPYFTTKEPDKGTGLGLAVVHGIVKDHNGYLKVYSKKDQGTTFYVFLPVSEKKAGITILKKAEAHLVGGTENIMVVDDEENIRSSIQAFLENQGYQIFSFANGEEALQAFKKDPKIVDFIITDMTMPVLTGDVLAKKVLKIRPNFPIILCSGYSEKISEEEIRKIGVYKFMQKPIILNNLAKTIRKKLDDDKKNKIATEMDLL
ncbi:MAG: PAS domain S-box protein, partial [Proteobacteria bacterium]|nr:PAS domain S-box protein [Pseudomonadota bacterium]